MDKLESPVQSSERKAAPAADRPSLPARLWHALIDPLREHRQDLLLANLAYFGLVLLGAVISARNPALQRALLDNARTALTQGPLATVAQLYVGGHLIPAILLTFAFNLFVGTFIFLTLPSLTVPFAGVVLGLIRAFSWGLLFSPTNPTIAVAMIPHLGTMLLEGEAYVLAMMGAFVLWRNVLWPEASPAGGPRSGPRPKPDRVQAYIEGVRLNLRLYVPITALLLIAAVYEVLELVYIVPRLLER
ncbi:MAG: hypothetical protein C4289_16295 [Chloroflexota bacterium]